MNQDFSYDIKTLISQIAEGDERAFRQVFEHYKERFYTAAFKMTHSADDAEEIVQEVFVSIWKKRKIIALAEKPESYLYTILQHGIYAHFRKIVQERRRVQKIAEDAQVCEESVESLMVEKEKNFIFDSVINRLPPQQKRVYQLAKQDGISREEIARQLNISPNTVRNHLAAAVDFLRTWLRTNGSALGGTVFFLSSFNF